MSLEDDINQRKFRNEHQKAAINLIYTSSWLNEQMKSFFDNYDITAQQFNILRILRGAGEPLSTMQIRERMLDKMSDTSRIVDRLVKKEMVKKNIRKTDRRLVDVTITEKGKELLAELDSKDAEMDAILHGLDETDVKQINQLLDKMRRSS
ncbi:MAG TPA: MarR family transcriptional regulator [Puia sp.]|jgi:DNA-binding MarR family transcriptional regulator|nr:MarR family transcriptional regulator [Puia sp.]